ncbi:MAG: NAD(P)-binding domain-containing protein [Thiohalocapsa sp.]
MLIIGAGPYGLSIAAHLRSLGIGYRIFGRTMSNWREKMPQGMLLKSDPYASNLNDPQAALTLGAWCRSQGIPYDDEAIRVSVENFIAYGEAFQRRFVPDLEERMVVSLEKTGDGFAAKLDNGEVAIGQKAVVAIGVSDFPYLPPVLQEAPPEFVTHASEHADLEVFRGREVALVGAGSSAVDLGALLHEAGAAVSLVARRNELRFHDRGVLGSGRALSERIAAPNTGIGPGWRNVFFTRTPHLFRYLPADLRQRQVENTHGPAGGWFMRDRIVGKVPLIGGVSPRKVEVRDGKAVLYLARQDGSEQTLAVDHVIACTGYRIDLRRIGFLTEALRTQIRLIAQAPELSAHFETSVPGLYVVGPAAAYSFGPVCRFVVGAEFTTPRIVRHLAGSLTRRPMVQKNTPPVTARP